MFNFLDSTIGSTHLDAPDGGGGGSAPPAPIGTEPSGGGNASPSSSEPQVYDLDDNSVIRIKGSDKTVPFKDVRGFQSQFTKASQEVARLKQALQNEQITRQRYEQEMQSLRQRTQQGQQGGQQPDVYDSLRKLPYLTGEDAVGVVQNISTQIQQRDQVLLATLKELQKVQNIVNGLHQNHTNTTFEGKISGWLKESGYGPEYANIAKEIYLAYEPGEELDAEFPTIFANRMAEIERLQSAKKQAALNQNRRQPFIPGKGGNGQPSKGLDIKANSSAKEVTDMLWGQWSGQDT